jgi:uncharacterized protein with HEPN domain
MAPEAAKFLWDAVEAASAAQRFAQGKSLDDYLGDELLRSGIERQLEIFGEALNRFRKLDEHAAERIDDLPRAVALRNILVHGYATVDPMIVWGVLAERLNPMLVQLKALLIPD